MTSEYLERPLRSIEEVLRQRRSAAIVAACEKAGLHRCPNAPAAGPPVVCGCAPGRCAEAEARR